jgi:predicted 3-demethylubiquinone-9 3-methyltransferase (glyoxalase superfamily)
MSLYTSLFEDSRIENIQHFGAGQDEQEGTVMHAVFRLAGLEFMAMDSKQDHQFTFTEATSFYVNCETQEEVDFFWEKLGEGGDENAQAVRLAQGQVWRLVANRPLCFTSAVEQPGS